jgi:phosphoglycolate phosphatase
MLAPATDPRRFDLIVFDWDGTLFDSTGIITRCIQEAVREVGGTVPSDEQAAWVIGLGLQQALAHAAPDVPPEKHKALGNAYRQQWAMHVDDLSLFDGTLPMLQALRTRGHLTAVATGKSRRGLDDVLARSFNGIQLKPLFDATRTADETAGKPDPMMLHELMEELQITPEKTLMIGDTTHDLQLAANAGVASLAVSFGAHDHALFDSHQPLAVLHSMRELHGWLLAHA